MASVRAFAARAEALPYTSLWVAEEILGGAPALEPLTLLAYLAAATTRLRLGVAVLVLSRHNPILLAKSLASLDLMSNGRLDVGVGLGYVGIERPFGYGGEQRVTRFNEALAVMKALWTQPAASFEGSFWSFAGQTLWPRPVQQPHPPIWFGGRTPAALRRAARHGDAFIGAGAVSTVEFAAQVALLRTYLVEEGRATADFAISKRVFIALDRKEERARRRLAGWCGLHYGDPDLAARVAVWGDREACRDQLQQLLAAGATQLLLNPVYDVEEQMALLAAEVLPALAPE